jgi:Uma2 family endonuclease
MYDLGKFKISPRAKNYAERLRVDLSEVIPTGPNGRIIERDIIEVVNQGHQLFDENAEDSVPDIPQAEIPAESEYTETTEITETEDAKLPDARKIIATLNTTPSGPNNSIISGILGNAFRNYLSEKNGKNYRVYNDNNCIRLDIIRENINLPEACKKDKYIPSVMVICDRSIDTINGVTGAPDLVVEVLSRNTERYDSSIKKEVYETIGVKEYWIVDYVRRSIKVYALENDRYGIPDIYYRYSDQDLIEIKEQDNDLGIETPIITEFSPAIFPDLIIKIDDIFNDLIEE